MFDQNSLLFFAIGLIGLGFMVFGFKYVATARKVIETIGAVLFHVGVFGIIYLKSTLNLFICVVAAFIGLFILIDPLKISSHVHHRIFKLFGFISIFVSVIFFLEHVTGFPVWLWIIPIILYLLPYLIPPLKKIAWFISLISWLLILSYVGISGYVLYTHFNPGTDTTLIEKMFPQLKLKTTPQPTPPPAPQQTLQQKYDELKTNYEELLRKNEPLEETKPEQKNQKP